MLRKSLRCAAVVALICNPVAAFAHELGAHVHGVATLQIAVDSNTLTLDLSSPLDNLLGFEHAAHTAEQKAAVQRMVASLNQADRLFVPSAAAQCTLQSVQLDSPVLQRQPAQASGERPHADLDGEFVFTCERGEQLHDLEVKLFAAYPNLHRIDVEIATAHKQAAATLTAAQPRANW